PLSDARRCYQVVAELPSAIEEFSSNTAALIPPKVLADVQLLQKFFVADTSAVELPSLLLNVILTPLVVLGHLAEYTTLTNSTLTFDGTLGEVFRLYTGMLASFAIAASENRTSPAHYGAVALRLAVLIGAIVDASEDEAAAGPSRSFAAAWSGSLGHEDISNIISTVPKPQWSDVLSEAIESMTPGVDYSMLMFGSERYVPPSLIPRAVQQSRYFRKQDPDRHVGCYIGVCSVDYENNIACHQPNAYSSIGNLRGFIAGKVSHYFGWTGPGLTIDTACSSSAVAIYQACQAILTGECNTTLAGGTHVMTSPLWFQNLASASFLSPTGSCKPFDAAADGYCRGEGVATVVLKRLSAAIANGDTVFATIAGTAVQQNENCTPIFPEQITVVEAHGTGTPVGDPVEYNSVREVLGSDKRTSNIALSSVKGLIGHLECTSGVVSLIKIVVIMLKGSIPPQASFKNINPAIHSSPSDHITIPTNLLPWPTVPKAALINNYGASGSNASIVVKESSVQRNSVAISSQQKHIFCFSALDRKSLARYIQRFCTLLDSQDSKTPNSLQDISFNLLREFNPTLPERLIVTASSISGLDIRLRNFEQDMAHDEHTHASRPVILCFGGQSSTFVGLDQSIY
ncbi:hypothetical protein D6C98_10155, partial [Aureobasidium pullulans]